MLVFGHLKWKCIKQRNNLPFVLLNAGIFKEGKSLEVLFLGLSRPLQRFLSGGMGADPFTIGPVMEDGQHKKENKH